MVQSCLLQRRMLQEAIEYIGGKGYQGLHFRRLGSFRGLLFSHVAEMLMQKYA